MTDENAQAPDTSSDPNAAKLEAILHLLWGATTDEELDEARKKAELILNMSAEDIAALTQGDQDGAEAEEDQNALIKHLRQDNPARYSRQQYQQMAQAAREAGDHRAARILSRQAGDQ